MVRIDEVAAQVQRNCRIADARRWGFFSVCGLLMRLRELYKRERGMPPWARVETAAILPWVGEQEAAWAALEDTPLEPLRIGGTEFDPMDEDGANARLLPEGWLYVAGQGPGRTPLFVLGAVEERREACGAEVFVVGRELAHDLVPVPAMSRPGRIVARRDAMLAHLWSVVEEAALSRDPAAAEDALRRAGMELREVAAHPAAHAAEFHGLASREIETAVLHELGELAEDARRRGRWEALLLRGAGTKADILGRALKDALADAGERGTLAALIADRRVGPLALLAAAGHGLARRVLPETRTIWDLARQGRWEEADAVRREAERRLEGHLEALFGIFTDDPPAGVAAARADALEGLLLG